MKMTICFNIISLSVLKMFAYDYFKIQRVTQVLLCFQILYIFQRCLYHDDFEKKNIGRIGNIEDTKEIMRSRKLKKDIQHNGQQEKDKKDNNGLQNITQKNKDRTTWTPLKTGWELMCSDRVSSSFPKCGTHRVTLLTKPVISHQWGKERVVMMTNWTYLSSVVTKILRGG